MVWELVFGINLPVVGVALEELVVLPACTP